MPRCVILRDDDTNAFTPVECLDRLYRPFLERGLAVNLATIPAVTLDARREDGEREEFLAWAPGAGQGTRALRAGDALTEYLRSNPRFNVAQHGLHHTHAEFERAPVDQADSLLERGRRILVEAGLPPPVAFVAPHDKFSPGNLAVAARKFPVISSGWYELRRLPCRWWSRYLLKKAARQAHWQIGRTRLLSHPGCLLSRYRDRAGMLDRVIAEVRARPLTVLVTHWWEYFPERAPDGEFIAVLHRVAEFLAGDPDIRVLAFKDLAS